jgi:hypothetical protein
LAGHFDVKIDAARSKMRRLPGAAIVGIPPISSAPSRSASCSYVDRRAAAVTFGLIDFRVQASNNAGNEENRWRSSEFALDTVLRRLAQE